MSEIGAMNNALESLNVKVDKLKIILQELTQVDMVDAMEHYYWEEIDKWVTNIKKFEKNMDIIIDGLEFFTEEEQNKFFRGESNKTIVLQ